MKRTGINTQEFVARTMKDFNDLVEILIDRGYENLGSWEFYNKERDFKIILKLDLKKGEYD